MEPEPSDRITVRDLRDGACVEIVINPKLWKRNFGQRAIFQAKCLFDVLRYRIKYVCLMMFKLY